MSDIGPALPPHLLAKRKRRQEEQEKDEPATASGAKAPSSPDAGEKRRRVIGPAMPPAALDERPSEAPNTEESDSDDDDDGFGPTLPPSGANTSGRDNEDGHGKYEASGVSRSPAPEKLRRDDWMTMPPKQDDLAARMDPTKQRARGFNTGKSAKGPSGVDDSSSAWNETAEQKQKRLRDEMMGVTSSASPGPQTASKASKSAKQEAEDAKRREEIEKRRGPALMDTHKQGKGKDVDDDPSKRAFDREKDMGSGMRIGHTQREEMLKKASGFSSKFSGGSFL